MLRLRRCAAIALLGLTIALPVQAEVAAQTEYIFASGFETYAPQTDAEAARFLAQATFGPTMADIGRLLQIGYRAWLDEQFNLTPSLQVPYLDFVAAIPEPVYQNARMEAWFCNAITGPDQLRQRVAYAFSQILVVSDGAGYAACKDARPGLALPLSSLTGTALNPLTAQSNGRQYALHPAAAPLRSLFESGRCAVVANVGPLIEPVTRTSFLNGSAQVPPQLFSHSDQQVFWETSRPDSREKIGWAGRMADLLQASNPNPQLSMSISLRGQNFLQTGVTVQPYSMGTQGTEARDGYLGNGDNAARRTAIDALLNGPLGHPLERASADIQKRSRDSYALVTSALAANTSLTTPVPILPTGLGLVADSAHDKLVGQLRMVGRMIQTRSQLGQRRQIFYVAIGGYDFHDRLQNDHRDQMAALSHALQMFHAITVELGMQDKVTTFTASDFGRTSSANGDGSDHGWGGEHFVLGGAVRLPSYRLATRCSASRSSCVTIRSLRANVACASA
ncbi:MAG: DUF1800 family protein [Dokdonella sp.]